MSVTADPKYSERAKRLLEALHTPFTNEERIALIQAALDAERDEEEARWLENLE